jgi:hypothetical protein
MSHTLPCLECLYCLAAAADDDDEARCSKPACIGKLTNKMPLHDESLCLFTEDAFSNGFFECFFPFVSFIGGDNNNFLHIPKNILFSHLLICNHNLVCN